MPGYLFALFVIGLFSSDEPPFQPQVVDHSISIGYGLAIGDVDGDGKPDILLADKKQFVWYRNGDWKRFVMAENLTASDNVCIAARDIDRDGKVEVAVGAQWNPAETADTVKSGAVFYLSRPNDPTQPWKATALHHEPTVHRMRWVKVGPTQFHLVVVPLHGRGNANGAGEGVKVLAYIPPTKQLDDATKWKYALIDRSMHLTHNLDIVPERKNESIYVGGKEGIKAFYYDGKTWKPGPVVVADKSFGEVRRTTSGNETLVAAVEPMHGTDLTLYVSSGKTSTFSRNVLTTALNQGHALAVGDLMGLGNSQVVVGWREPDADKKTGIKMFIPVNGTYTQWNAVSIDDNEMACEDLQVADLDGDDKKEIIAAGRASHNLKIYWNHAPAK